VKPLQSYYSALMCDATRPQTGIEFCNPLSKPSPLWTKAEAPYLWLPHSF